MTKMIIYCFLLISLFLSIESSSIRGLNLKNDLVPLENPRFDAIKKDSDSLKILSSEPFIVQLRIPKPEENENKETKEKDKKRKQSAKKRVSKIKLLRKKYRKRRDLSKIKTNQDKSNQLESLHAVSATAQQEHQLKNNPKNSINRVEILKALSLYSKKKELKRNKAEGIKNVRNDEYADKSKHNTSTPNRNLPKPHLSQTEQTPHAKTVYPSTPKSNRTTHTYTYQDLVADRERLEQKIKYIKNMLTANDSTTDDMIRVRRKSESDRTANKIAKIFLTLSAVNGLHDKRKSKYAKDDEDENDPVQDVWEKEKKSRLNNKSSSSNEERYKVKKWIEFMKNKRSSSKTCPCVVNFHEEEGDAFPLEQKLPKDYFLLEKGRSSEESSESYRDSICFTKNKLSRPNYRKQSQKSQEEQENKLKGLGKDGRRKLELPFDDLELYRSRAKQILQNAEEILDRIKEEEEKRLSAPNTLLSQLKELTTKIQGDPRNNENYLIRKLQKNFGWGPLAKPQEDEGKDSFKDNVKSFILDPYEKAKALTDESTKKLSSYLLRNLGKIQESSEDQDGKKVDDEIPTNNLQVYFDQIPHKKKQPPAASLAKEELKPDLLSKSKEDLQNWEDTIFKISKYGDEPNNQKEQYKQKMGEIIKEQQNKINSYKVAEDSENNSTEVDSFNFKTLKDKIKTEKLKEETRKGTEPEKIPKDEKTKKAETVKLTKENIESTDDKVSLASQKPFLDNKEKFRSEKGESDGTTARNMQEEKEFEKEIEEIIRTVNEKNSEGDGQEVKIKLEENQETSANDNSLGENQDKKNEKESNTVPKVVTASSNSKIYSKEDNKDSDVVASPYFLNEEDDFEASPRFLAALQDYLTYDDENDMERMARPIEPSEKLKEETVSEKQEKDKNDSTNTNPDENLSTFFQEPKGLKESFTDATPISLTETLKDKETKKLFKNDTTPMEVKGEKILEYADIVEEPNQNSRVDQQPNEYVEEETQANKDILKSERLNGEEKSQTYENISKKKENPDTEEATDNKADLTKSEEIVESYTNKAENNQKDINENSSLKKNSENGKPSSVNGNSENQEELKDENGTLLQTTKSEKITKENNSDDIFAGNKSREVFNAEHNEENLKSKEFTDEDKNESSVESKDDSNQGKILKKANDDKETENSEESILKVPLDRQRDKNENEETIFEKTDNEVADKSINQDENSTDKVSINKMAHEDDENSLTATNPRQDDSETENSEIGHKDLPEESLEDEYSNEKTFLKSEKLAEEDDLKRNLKGSDEESETLGESLNGETLDESNETAAEVMNPRHSETENTDDNDEATLQAEYSLNETSQEQEDVTEKVSLNMSKPDEMQQENSDEKGKGETLKATLDVEENEYIKKADEKDTSLRMPKDEKSEDLDKRSSGETLEAVLEDQDEKNSEESEISLNTEKFDKVQDKNAKEKSDEETLKATLEVKEENTEAANGNETYLTEKKPDEVQVENSSEKSSEETLKAILDDQNENKTAGKSDKAQDNTATDKGVAETLKMAFDNQMENTEETDEGQSSVKIAKLNDTEETWDEKSSDETLKTTLGDQKEEHMADEDEDETLKLENDQDQEEPKSKEKGDYDTLQADLDKQIEENLNEERNKEAQKEIKNTDELKQRQENESNEATDLKMTLENQNPENVQKISDKNTSSQEINFIEEAGQDAVKSVFDDHKHNLKENEETLLRAGNLSKDLNSQEEEPDNLDFQDGMLNNGIDDVKTQLKSIQSTEDTEELASSENTREREETYRERNFDDLNNRIDTKSQDETLRSVHLDERNNGSEESLYETLKALNLPDENLSLKKDVSDPNSKDPQKELVSDSFQEPGFTKKHLKTGNLKVPKSIGKIMEDLDEKEKGDVTSLQNLNPEKIDHIIDKIDEAEQQTLLKSQEVDCRKECKCVDEIETKSKNIGRYEIVKDFLHWMKDLQLNRVLSDD